MTAFAPGRARLTFGYGSTRSDRSWSRERLESARNGQPTPQRHKVSSLAADGTDTDRPSPSSDASPPIAPESTSPAQPASGRSRRPRSGGMFSGLAIRRSPPRSGFSPATFKADGDRVIVPSIFETRRSRGLLEMKY